MKNLRASAAAFLAAFTIVACSDDTKTPNAPGAQAPEAEIPAVRQGGLTTQITDNDVTGTLRITQFAVRNGELVAHGVFNGSLTSGKAIKNLQVRNIPVRATEATTSQVQQVAFVAGLVQGGPSCPILHLEVGPIFLDLLGLVLETEEIVIDLRAEPGPGNLLGNLLCAIVGLLDQTPLNVALINQILALINNLLSQF
jgi:hypothetical protein